MISLSIPRINGMIFAVRGNYYDGEEVMAGDTAGFNITQVMADSKAIDTYITDRTGEEPKHPVVRYTKLAVLDLDEDGKTELDRLRESVQELEKAMQYVSATLSKTMEEKERLLKFVFTLQWIRADTYYEESCPRCFKSYSEGHDRDCDFVRFGIVTANG